MTQQSGGGVKREIEMKQNSKGVEQKERIKKKNTDREKKKKDCGEVMV